MRLKRLVICSAVGTVWIAVAAAVAVPGFPPFLRTWGTAGSAPGSFRSPDEIAIDARGQVYVADRKNDRVQKFDYRGRLLSVIVGAVSPPVRFHGPRGVAVDVLGDLYVADSGNNRIEKFDPRGKLVSVWGRNGGDGSAGVAPGQFDDPRGIATDAAGDLYVADHGNNRVQKLSPRGKVLEVLGLGGGDGRAGAGDGEFRKPRGLTVDRFGNLYVADKGNNRIQKFNAHGRFLRRWGRSGGDGTAGTGNGEFHIPYSVAAGRDELWVADTGNNRLQEFTFNGRFIARLGANGGDGTAGSAPGEFSTPYGVGVDCRGNLYVADEGNERVQVFGAPDGRAPVCPPVLTLGKLSGRLHGSALLLRATCDVPCTLIIRATVQEPHAVQRVLSGSALGLGVHNRTLQIELPSLALHAVRTGTPVWVSVRVGAVGFGGRGGSLTRSRQLGAV